MKQNKLTIFLLLFILFGINIINVNAETLEEYVNDETQYKAVLEDEANLLTYDEIEKLQIEMIPLTKYGNIVFKTIYENPTTTEDFASEYYSEKFGVQSGTIFLIDMDNRIIYIYSNGKNYDVINDDNAYIITDNVYRYASTGDYYKCASEAFAQMEKLLVGEKIAAPMRYISNILISITVSAFLAFFVVAINTRIRKADRADILKNCNITFYASNIHATKTGTSKKYSPRSDSGSSFSSSSSRSSGGFSGGGRSGGGGGHRF